MSFQDIKRDCTGSFESFFYFSLYKDQQGSIWVGTYYGGVNYFNPVYDIFSITPIIRNGMIV